MSGESRSVVVRLSLDTAQAIRASKDFGTEFGRAMDQAEKHTTRTRSAMDELTSSSGKIALAATAGLAAVVATTANFDEAMSHVAATGDDARSSIDQLREAAIQAGQDTAFSATEAAGGVENLAKAGVSAQDILGGGLKGSLDLAAAGGLDVADAAQIAATALTQFKLQGEDVPHVADLLAAAAGKAQGDVSDLSMALKQSGLVASQMGISIEDTTGTLAAFASQGLLGSDAGTSFRTMLLRLANPTNESAQLMDSLGIAAYDAGGKFVGMASLAGQLQTALQDKTQAERDSALATIFGSDAIRAANVLYTEGASGIAGWSAKVNDAGYAAETAATRMDNLKGDLEQLRGSLETALIGSGEGSTGLLRTLTQDATKLVNVFNKAPEPVQQTVTGLLAVTAIGAGAFWFTSKAVTTISDTKSALDQLGLSAGRTGTALKVIGGLGAAATVLIAVEQAAAAAVRSTDKAAPGIESLTRSLLNLQSAQGLNKIATDVGDLSSAIDMLGDPGMAQQIGDIYDKVPLVGSAFADIAPGLRGARQEARDAATTIGALDDALAGIVSTGSPEQARDTFDQLAAAYHLTAEEQKNLLSLLPGYKEALAGAANSTQLAGDATGDFGTKQRQAAAQTKALRAALQAEREDAQKTAASFLQFGDSLDDSKVSLAQWIRQMQKQAAALQDFTQNARTAARRGLDEGLIKSLEAAGPAGALRMKQLANATDSELDRANAAWRRGQAAIREYVNMDVPAKVLRVEDAQAMLAINRIKAQLAGIPRSISTTYYVNQVNRINKGPVTGPGSTSADGGTVPKTGLPYADRHPYLLADGEEVISNRYGQADRHRPLLKAINANRLADGGTAGGNRGDDGTTRSVRSLQAALDKLTKSLEKETKLRDDLLQVRSSVKEGLRTDIFATTNSWSSAGSPNGALRGDIAQGRHFIDLVQELERRGVDGAALQEIVATGDVQRAELMASLSRGGLRTYERLYNQRERVLAHAGAATTQALGMGEVVSTIKELRGDIKRIEHTIKVKQAHDHKSRQDAAKTTADGVNGAARSGHHRGSKG